MDIHIDVRCECFSTLAATIEYDSALDELVAIVTPCSACHVAAIEKLEAELEEALKLKDQFSDALAKKFDATVMPIWNELKAKLDKLRTEREKLRKALKRIQAEYTGEGHVDAIAMKAIAHDVLCAEQALEVTKDSPTLEDLAKAQGVKPLKDVGTIVGTWPGEKDDGFEQDIDELRKGTK